MNMQASDVEALPEVSKRQPRFPRMPLFGAMALIAVALTLALFGRLTDIGTVRVVTSAPLEIRDLSFHDMADGSIAVRDARVGGLVALVAPGEGGFVRGTMRGLGRERTRRAIPLDAAFRLIAWEGGALTLTDTATGQRVFLNAFGPDNVDSFMTFLKAERTQSE